MTKLTIAMIAIIGGCLFILTALVANALHKWAKKH